MNTTATPARRSTQATGSARPAASDDSADLRTLVRVVGIVIVAGVLVAILPEALISDADWSSARTFVAWTSLGLPIAFLALAALLWRTRGASRLSIGASLLGTAAMGIGFLVTAIGGEYVIPGFVDRWISMIAFVLLQVVVLDAIVRAAWAAPLRALLGIVVSWPLVAVVLATLVGEGAMWWAAFGTLAAGFAAAGVALAVRPGLAFSDLDASAADER